MSNYKLPNLQKASTLIPHPFSRSSSSSSSRQNILPKRGSVKFTGFESFQPPPIAQFLSAQTSPTNKDCQTENEHLATLKKSKPKRLAFDSRIEEDEVLDQALLKLDQILRRQAEKNHRKKLHIGDDGNDHALQKNISVANVKNLEMVGRITKYKNIKGITPKTKEVRFEERLSLFKGVKTFVDIRQVVKGIGTPEKTMSSHSGGRSVESPKMSFFKKLTEPDGFNEMYDQVEKNISHLPSPRNHNQNQETEVVQTNQNNEIKFFFTSNNINVQNKPTSQQSDTRDFVKEVDKEKEKRFAPKKRVKVSEKVKEVHNRLKEQIVSQMGVETLDKIEKDLMNKNKRKEVWQKKEAELNNLREMQKDLNNFELFNNLVEYLSERGVYEEDAEIGKEGPPEGFYKQLDKKLFMEQNKEEEFPAEKKTIIAEEEDETEFQATKTTWEGGYQNDLVADDEQLRVMNALQAYKDRSDKVISILKRKTNRIRKEQIVKRKAAVVKEKLSNVLKTMESIREVPEGTANTVRTFNNLKNERRNTVEKDFYKSFNVRSSENFYTSKEKAWPNDVRKSSAGNLSSTLHQITLDNKKKFIELKDQKKEYYLTQGSSGKTWFSRKDADKMRLTPHTVVFPQKGTDSFNNSVKKICGDVGNMLANNKTLNHEVKKSIAQVEKYYVDKAKYVKNEEIPESLLLPKKPKNLNKKATFIMELTRKLLKQNS